MTLKFDGWPSKTIGHLFYAISSFVHHFVAIAEFKHRCQFLWSLVRWLMQQRRYFCTHWNVEICVVDVYGHYPLSGLDSCPDELCCLHLEVRDYQMPFERGQGNDRMHLTSFLGNKFNKKESAEEAPWKKRREWLLQMGSMAPFFSSLFTASCGFSLFLVGNCMGVLVRGGKDPPLQQNTRTQDLGWPVIA